MIISLVQTSIEWLAPIENCKSAEEWIKKCQGSTLCLLPEMFATGFSMSPELATRGWEQTLEWMKSMAQRYQVAIGGGVAVRDVNGYCNRFYVVSQNGEVKFYDKRHLFSFAGEDQLYTSGQERVIVEIDGVRILLLVCYDLRFPVWSRNCGDYDVAIYIANWPTPRREAWDALLRARAIENLAYVGGVNIVGEDPNCRYSGGTAAIDYKGNTIAAVADNCEGIATFNVDIEGLRRFRVKFPALDDADNFEIK